MPGMKTSNSGTPGIGCSVLFLLPFTAVGVFLAGRMVWHISFWMVAQSWVECPAFIDHVELDVHSDEGTTYNTSARYRYQYKGVEYSGARVWLLSGSDSGSFHQNAYRQLLDHQQAGKLFRCFVDPDEPDQSVLYRDLRPSLLWFYSVFVTVFGGFGIGGLFFIVRQVRHSRKVRLEAERFPNEPWKWAAATATGQFYPGREWLSHLFGALVFNGLTIPGGFFLYLAKGKALWALGILILFTTCGFWLVWKAVRMTLQRRRYGPISLQIQPWPYFVGEPLEGMLNFRDLFPSSRELIFELRVLETGHGDDSDTEVFKETMHVSNGGRSTSFRFHPPQALPRTRRDNDHLREKTAKWTLKVTGSDGPGDFRAQFSLATFAKTE